MRLIDADRIEPHGMLESLGNGRYECVRVAYMDDIDALPTVDAVPVRRGKWKHKKDLKQFFCNQCGEPSLTEDDVYFYSMEFPNFCPNCGARMENSDG